MDIAILLFDGITALDAIGPYEVLSRLPGARVRFVGLREGPVRTDNQFLGLVADEPLDAVTSTDVLLLPGGFGTRALERDPRFLEWVRGVHSYARFTTSVCTGSLLLGAAGLLKGLSATTHWTAVESLERYGAHYAAERVVRQGSVITAAGVSAGIDMALVLADLLSHRDVAEAIQLGIEYDPQPPFDSGSVSKARPAIVDAVRSRVRSRMDDETAA